MAYREWGDPDNTRVLVCVHGLTRTSRDFDALAARMSSHYRVVCPDVVGRGQSDWLRNPASYVTPQYVADMVTLIARLGVESVDWFGTSMGGLIGMILAGFSDAPVGRLLLNDIGPRIELAALSRIGGYLALPLQFATEQEGIDYLNVISSSFGAHTPEQWRSINAPMLRLRNGSYELHYDPSLAVPFRALSPEAAEAGEAASWLAFEAIRCPVLVVRGELSDLLSRDTVDEMKRRGRAVTSVEIPDVGHAPLFIDEEQIQVAERFFTDGGI
jgi:pimeloyl-ACP methyl ester carboxylesterase